VIFSPSVLEEIFHVKSRVSAAFSFIVLRYLLIALIISGIRALGFKIDPLPLRREEASGL
jgi:hypothetical protein